MPENNDLPESLPTIAANECFHFACGPEQPCFNRCCSQLNLPLTPYDALRLRRNMELPSEEFLSLFTSRSTDHATGFPVFQLRMIESPEEPCPFVTPAGCSVYEDRPGACRSYPLGRGTRLGHDCVVERFFMIREEHCAGFDSPQARTPTDWMADQGLEPYNRFNDRYMRLLSLIRAGAKPVPERLVPMIILSLWQTDLLVPFLKKMNILSQIEWNSDTAALEHAGSEAALEFGLDWLELMIFGQAPNMRRLAAAKN